MGSFLDFHIIIEKFLLRIKAKDPLIFPAYKGSTFRGAFGTAFKRVVCALKSIDCKECILKEKCIYSYVFETYPSADTRVMRKYESVPHPFIIEPPPETKRIYKPGEVIEFTLVLISKALDYLPYFIYTFDQLGSMGIGKGRGKFELLSVHKLSSDVADEHAQEMIYSAETKTMKSFSPSQLHVSFNSSDHSERDTHLLSIDFLTPTKIIYQGNPTTDLEFHIFMRQLLRRVSLLAYFHSGIDTTTWDFRGIIDQSEKVKIKENNLKWYDWQRYSSRQNSKINMGGITGNISYEGILAPFKTLIKAGEILHIGKGTTFGQGKYRIIKMEEFH